MEWKHKNVTPNKNDKVKNEIVVTLVIYQKILSKGLLEHLVVTTNKSKWPTWSQKPGISSNYRPNSPFDRFSEFQSNPIPSNYLREPVQA